VELAGRTAWVVGASSGIGAALARELAARGARVAVSARRKDLLAEVAGGRMLVVPADVTSAEQMRDAAATVRADLGPLDIAVLNAGYWRQMAPGTWDAASFERHLQVNLGGMSHALAAVLPQMVQRGEGVIAGVASVAGYRGLPGAEAYGATKAAQISMLESLRVSLAGRGVHVTTICPGFVRTDMTAANAFPMPFIIEPDAAARAICDGLERGRAEILFPVRMAALMKLARLLPVALWPRLWACGRRG
jgi:NAD(P)-dependent dehydrogenase (short-subunit alcohol dehydrogenase family)